MFKSNTQELIEYCMSFYGDVPGSLRYFDDWGYPPLQVHEIMAILPKMEEVHPKEFVNGKIKDVDSLTRERVRDFVFMGRGYDVNTEHITSLEAMEVWDRMRDQWRDQMERVRQDRELSFEEHMKIWREITKEGEIKPKWFGFLSN